VYVLLGFLHVRPVNQLFFWGGELDTPAVHNNVIFFDYKVLTGFWWGNLRKSVHLEDTGVHGRII
jgi:hypothetical protein